MAGKDPRRRAAKQKRRAARKARAKGRQAARPAGYHAEQSLDAQRWKGLAPEERLARVEAFHRRLPADKQPPDLRRHAALHVLVEDQLAAGDPPEVLQALGRLVMAGMSRHDALHAVGFVATQVMQKAIETRSAPNFAAYAAQLRELDRPAYEALVQRSLA